MRLIWRRGWDSNPRARLLTGQDAFEAPPLQPLRYLSVGRVLAGPTTSLSSLLNIVAPIPEEVLHQLATIVLQDARDDGQPVRDPYALQIQNGFHRTKFGLRRPINQGAHPGVNDGADAHQARLHRHVKREASKAIVAKVFGGLANRH